MHCFIIIPVIKKDEGVGLVKFVGSLLPNKTGLWVGIERITPKSKDEINESHHPEGYNGKLGDMKYFDCKKNKGIFVPYNNVHVQSENTNKLITTALSPSLTPQQSEEYSSVEDQKIQTMEQTQSIKQQLLKAQQVRR